MYNLEIDRFCVYGKKNLYKFKDILWCRVLDNKSFPIKLQSVALCKVKASFFTCKEVSKIFKNFSNVDELPYFLEIRPNFPLVFSTIDLSLFSIYIFFLGFTPIRRNFRWDIREVPK